MNVKILRVYEKDGLLRVETECEYGHDDLGLSLDTKYKDTDGEYKWLKEVKKLLAEKYQQKEKDAFKQFKNKTIKI